MNVKRFLAFDIGASYGRAVVGEFDGARLICKDICHFPNESVKVHNSIYWDMLRLFGDVKKGLVEYSRQFGCEVDGIGIDTWGNDFGLIDRTGQLLGNPYHYRDRRCEGMLDVIRSVIDPYAIYSASGVQLAQMSAISHLFAFVRAKSPQFDMAQCFLMMPSIFSYFLTGCPLQEHSNISDTGLWGWKENAPVLDTLNALGIRRDVMPEVIGTGDVQGNLLPAIGEECGLCSAPVFAPATHDTASAVLSVPADPTTNWAFISSGTWSVVGTESDRPLTSHEAFEVGITSAATAEGKYMPRVNITGLWILQEMRRIWERQGDKLDWNAMVDMARAAKPFTAFIDMDDAAFQNPPDMPRALVDTLRRTGQSAPEDKGTLIRIVLESLAFKYRKVLSRIEKLTGSKRQVLHIVGGGVNNSLLCQLTANAVGIPVLAGPVEGTSAGNLLVQMVGAGLFDSVVEGRVALRPSFDVVEYEPQDAAAWDEAYEKYQNLGVK